MEEKERYKYYTETNQIYDSEEDELYAYNLNNNKVISILNQQDKRIKELELLLKADKKIETNSLNGFEKLRQKNQQLKQSQKQLAIAKLEEVKEYWDWYKHTEYKKGLLMDYFINNSIEELKGEE